MGIGSGVGLGVGSLGISGSPIHLRSGPFTENASEISECVPSRANLTVLNHPMSSWTEKEVSVHGLMRK